MLTLHSMLPIRAVLVVAAATVLGILALANLTSAPLHAGVATIRRAETSDGQPKLTVANMAAIQAAFESVGVAFSPTVKLRNGAGRQ